MKQALARLRFADEVAQEDLEEALRLHQISKESLNAGNDGSLYGSKSGNKIDEISQVQKKLQYVWSILCIQSLQSILRIFSIHIYFYSHKWLSHCGKMLISLVVLELISLQTV